MTPDARLARAARWKDFYEEEGGIGDMLASATAAFMREATQSEPWETDRLKKVALGMKIVGQLDQAVKSILADGNIAEHMVERARRIAELPERKRKWI